ncbi:MAG TPA: TatD family hydrolase [Rectinemataceae bacterium]
MDNLVVHSDAHVHLAQVAAIDPDFLSGLVGEDWLVASVSHDPTERDSEDGFIGLLSGGFRGFGIHPQDIREDTMAYLADLAASRKIDFIGEAGFDFYGDRPERLRTERNLEEQRTAFEFQLGLAAKHGLPILVHSRKGMDLLLSYKSRLATLAAVIFHSWPGRIGEARAFLDAGIEAYFSFGTTLVRGSPHARESCSGLPADRILAETDAPWQPLKGESRTPLEAISLVESAIASIRNMGIDELQAALRANFLRAFKPEAALDGKQAERQKRR